MDPCLGSESYCTFGELRSLVRKTQERGSVAFAPGALGITPRSKGWRASVIASAGGQALKHVGSAIGVY